MEFLPGELYHVYNRGNNSQKIFYTNSNYIFFLQKVRKELTPFCEILAYCLMPNHYHFLIFVKPIELEKNVIMHPLSRKIGTLQSSYCQAINLQENKKGSLFQQKAKSKHLGNYGFTCFHYIHQNPVKAKLCNKMEDWEFSSFQDYYALREGRLPNKQLSYDLLEYLENDSSSMINPML